MRHIEINPNKAHYLRYHAGMDSKEITEYFLEALDKKTMHKLVATALRGARDIRIPCERVKPVLDEWVEKNTVNDENGNPLPGAIQMAAGLTNLPARYFHRIRELTDPNITFDLLDRILLGLDLEHLWKESPENGGFSDFWGEDPPFPARPTSSQVERMSRERAQRAAATRKRRAETDPKCSGCGKNISLKNRSGMCKACNWDKNKPAAASNNRRFFAKNQAKRVKLDTPS